MKRWSWGASALGTLSVAVAVAAQEPRQDQPQGPRTTDQPQMKGMMTRGMPVHGMMPMMMEMHRQHAAMESQWEATDAGIFVLRPGTAEQSPEGPEHLVAGTSDLPGPEGRGVRGDRPAMPQAGAARHEACPHPTKFMTVRDLFGVVASAVIELDRGKVAMARRLMPIFEQGQDDA